MSDIQFVNGLIAKEPRQGSPDFIKAQLSIKRAELITWLQGRDDEWINLDVKESRAGKWFCAVNEWKPEGSKAAQSRQDHNDHPSRRTASKHADASNGFVDDQEIPFIPIPLRRHW